MSAETMDAGRRLDALVAERVMGFSYTYADPSAPTLLIAVRGVDTGRAKTILKPYSTDIAAAWKVVEKLNESERWPTIQFGPSESGYECWHVSLVNPADVEVSADSAPHAICLAALKAVGA